MLGKLLGLIIFSDILIGSLLIGCIHALTLVNLRALLVCSSIKQLTYTGFSRQHLIDLKISALPLCHVLGQIPQIRTQTNQHMMFTDDILYSSSSYSICRMCLSGLSQ